MISPRQGFPDYAFPSFGFLAALVGVLFSSSSEGELLMKRIKMKSISLMNTTGLNIWRPGRGVSFILTEAYMKVRETTGVNTTPPEIIIDNGTNGQNLVTQVATVITKGAYQRLAVIGNHVVDNSKPLRLRKAVAAEGSTKFLVDLIFFGHDLSK